MNATLPPLWLDQPRGVAHGVFSREGVETRRRWGTVDFFCHVEKVTRWPRWQKFDKNAAFHQYFTCDKKNLPPKQVCLKRERVFSNIGTHVCIFCSWLAIRWIPSSCVVIVNGIEHMLPVVQALIIVFEPSAAKLEHSDGCFLARIAILHLHLFSCHVVATRPAFFFKEPQLLGCGARK